MAALGNTGILTEKGYRKNFQVSKICRLLEIHIRLIGNIADITGPVKLRLFFILDVDFHTTSIVHFL